MTSRTTETTVTFARPFTLAAFDGPQPPGVYRVIIDEEEILGLSFLAYRRVATTLMTPAINLRSGSQQAHGVDHEELEAAIAADGAVQAETTPSG